MLEEINAVVLIVVLVALNFVMRFIRRRFRRHLFPKVRNKIFSRSRHVTFFK
jgi:uncharacterized membrane protein YoaK (UPF0700 family)